jgi:hypothetical protein
MTYYAATSPTFLYVLLAHCLIMAVCISWTIGTFCCGYCNISVNPRTMMARGRCPAPSMKWLWQVKPQRNSTPDASISLKANKQIASLSAAKTTPSAVWRSLPSRHGRCILRPTIVHANALRSAQPEGHPGTHAPSPLSPLFFSLPCVQIIPLVISDEPRTGAWARSQSKEV